MRILSHVTCITLMVLVLFSGVCDGKSGKEVLQSKDYKHFDAGSPSAVLTALVEADLGDYFNRENEDRYALWWKLTEIGGVPDNDYYIKLLIKSYKIILKNKDANNNYYLELELDVRAISASGDTKDKAPVSWRNIPVVVGNNVYGSGTKEFVEAVFGRDETSRKILAKEHGHFIVPVDKRTWVFPVRMIKPKDDWLIAMDSVPFQVNYVSSAVKLYKSEINREKAIINVCSGLRKVDNYVLERETYDVKRAIKHDLTKFKAKFCTEKYLKSERAIIFFYESLIDHLNLAAKDEI